MIFQLVQIGRIAFLKLTIRQAFCFCAFVPGVNQVAGNIDAEHVRSKPRLRQCSCTIATSQIQNLEALDGPKSLDEHFTALSHALSDARKIAFFPKCLVRVH